MYFALTDFIFFGDSHGHSGRENYLRIFRHVTSIFGPGNCKARLSSNNDVPEKKRGDIGRKGD